MAPLVPKDSSAVKLSTRPDKMARQLRALGFKGERGISCSCPLARYYERLLGRVVYITGRLLYALDPDGDLLVQPLTDSEFEFSTRFDAGAYPFLVSR